MQVTTIGLDIAKSVFQLHGVDEQGRVVLRQRLARGKVLVFFANLPRCTVGLEACGGAHHWARELGALGHEVRLMPPQYVKATSRPTSMTRLTPRPVVRAAPRRPPRSALGARRGAAARHAVRAGQEH
jgi:transposase